MKKVNFWNSGFKLAAIFLLGNLISGAGLINGEIKNSIPGKKTSAEEQPAKQPLEATSFLRKELLPKLDPAMARARRDLFKPSMVESNASSITNPSIKEQASPAEISPEESQDKSILESLNLTYLGLVSSGKRAMALVLLDGQAVTLSEGEEVIPGIRLAKITPQEILFKDNQGNSRKVSIKESLDENFAGKI
ncbi:MAG TPA: hypothetical protein ENO29_06705 [Candidatus Aminicenantes bacterium]|nr:MAG: hypothetical protein C0168_02495 [Candidatus Aminicenantes bacterium]HEK86028.1 hypothetical protein [Candidatus Aminicenantes bacterium]